MAGRYVQRAERKSGSGVPRGKPSAGEHTATATDEPAAETVLEIDRAAALREGARVVSDALAADHDFEHHLLTKTAFFTAPRRQDRRQELQRQLTQAGRQLVHAYRSLLEDRQVWDRLARQDFQAYELGLRGRALLLEGMQQHLVPALDHLGYGDGPPPAEEWIERVQAPLRILVHGVGPGQAAGLAAYAEHNLRELVERLDLLLEVVDQLSGPDADPDAASRLKSRLRKFLAAARDNVAPTLLIAFAGAAVGASVMGDPGAALNAGGADAVTKAMELGALAWLAQRRTPQGAAAAVDLQTGLKTLRDCITLAGDSPRDDYGALLVRRAAMQLVLDSARLKDKGADEQWWEWAGQVEDALVDLPFAQDAMMELWGEARLLVEAAT